MQERLARERRTVVELWRQDVARRPHGAWTDLGGLSLHATGLPIAPWNGAHLTHPDGLLQLEQAATWFAERNVPWGLLVPEELGLEPAGWHVRTLNKVMLRDLTDLPALPDGDLRWDGPIKDAVLVQEEAFEDPLTGDFLATKRPWGALVVLYENDEPLATATSIVVDGVCAIYGVATRVRARRRGLGRAATVAAMHHGRKLGADLAYLNPSDAGRGVYEALGFADAPPWVVWLPDQPIV